MTKLSTLKEVLAAITAEDNPAAPSSEFMDLHREGVVISEEQADEIVKKIDASPVGQIDQALKAITGILKGFLL